MESVATYRNKLEMERIKAKRLDKAVHMIRERLQTARVGTKAECKLRAKPQAETKAIHIQRAKP